MHTWRMEKKTVWSKSKYDSAAFLVGRSNNSCALAFDPSACLTCVARNTWRCEQHQEEPKRDFREKVDDTSLLYRERQAFMNVHLVSKERRDAEEEFIGGDGLPSAGNDSKSELSLIAATSSG